MLIVHCKTAPRLAAGKPLCLHTRSPSVPGVLSLPQRISQSLYLMKLCSKLLAVESSDELSSNSEASTELSELV